MAGGHLKMWRISVALLVLSIPGCTDSRPHGDDDLSLQRPASGDDSFTLTSCHGIGLGIDMATHLLQPDGPADWNASSADAIVGTLVYTLLECGRVSWGPFERGPVFLMQEWHNGFEPPGKCAKDGYIRQRMILRLAWFSDPDLARYAQEEFGMPAAFAEISYNISTAAGVSISHWTWNLPGRTLSEAFFRPNGAFMDTDTVEWRVFWENGNGVSYMDLKEVYKTPAESLGEAYGALAPPMLYGEGMADDTFVTSNYSDPITELDAAAWISEFGDSRCERPL